METILIQENDEATLEVITSALELQGYRVCSLSDHHSNALDMIRRYRPKLVLLDCWLGHHSGQVSHWIKAHFPKLPVIAFSSDNQIDQEYQRYGFDGYIKKPFELEHLYLTVRTHLSQRNKRTRLAVPA